MPTRLILGTRGSDLALAQATMVAEALRLANPGVEIERKIVRTVGDKRPDLKLSEFSQSDVPVDKGIFTKELEIALAEETIDFAVHSLKDVPTEIDPSFRLCATLPRAPVEDILITKERGGLAGLREGATVATSSVRRARQIHYLRPDLLTVDIRGNLPTRLRKLAETNDFSATMLAKAGLQRLGFSIPEPGGDGTLAPPKVLMESAPKAGILYAETLDPLEFLPAAGQGAVAIEIRSDDHETAQLIERINHAETFARISAERTFLALLNAGCHTPVGAHTVIDQAGQMLAMHVRVFDENKPEKPPCEATVSGSISDPDAVARSAYASMKQV